jgi:hypothetical protein
VIWWRGLDAVVRRAVVLVGIALLLVVIGLTVGWCSQRDDVARAKAGGTLADARANAGADASDVRDTVDGQIDTIRDNVRTGTDEIRNAPDGAYRDGAALRSLCRVDPSASPDCRLLQPRSR